MKNIVKGIVSFVSFSAGLGVLSCLAIAAGQNGPAMGSAAEYASALPVPSVVPSIDLPEVKIYGSARRETCFDDPRMAGRAELRARYGLDAGDEIADAESAREACDRASRAARNGFDRGAPKRIRRSAPTGRGYDPLVGSVVRRHVEQGPVDGEVIARY